MSKYYPTYSQYLGAQKCCEFRGQGPQGPEGPPGPSAVGQRGHTGATGSTGSFPELNSHDYSKAVVYDESTKQLGYHSTKTFIIDHPIDSDKYLVHTCLEGPEAGVYYRGIGKISNSKSVEIELPHYASTIAYDFTVNITPIYDGNIHILHLWTFKTPIFI
jgi:hypothetical protein